MVKRRCAGSNLPFNALSLFLLSRPPLRWNTHAVQSITGEHLFVRRLCGVALIAFRVIFNHYELVSHVCEWNWQSYLTLVFCPIRAKRSKIIFRRSFFFYNRSRSIHETGVGELSVRNSICVSSFFYSSANKMKRTGNYSLPGRRDFPTFLGGGRGLSFIAA